jgi:hypothetical protein
VIAYVATGVMAMLAMISAIAMLEPPAEQRLGQRRIALGAIRDVTLNPGIGMVILLSVGAYLMMRAGNGALFNPILASAGVPVHWYGRWMAAMSLGAAVVAWFLPSAP